MESKGTMKAHLLNSKGLGQLVLAGGLALAWSLVSCQMPTPSAPAVATPTVQIDIGQPLVPTPSPQLFAETATPPPSETPATLGNLSAAQAALAAYQPTTDATHTVERLLADIAAWLAAGNDPAGLEATLDEASSLNQDPVRATAIDLTGDAREDVVVHIPIMGLPLLVFVDQGHGPTGYALPPDFAQALINSWPGDSNLTMWGVPQSPLELIDLTGDGLPEIRLTFLYPGGSGFHMQPIVYQWHQDAFRPIFAAHVVSWAGEAGLALEPDPTGAGSQQIVLRYPYLYANGFDHKLVNHPLAQQIWRWDGEAGRFVMAEATLDLERSGWAPDATLTTADRLRWFTNQAEAAYRAGDFDQALGWYDRVLGLAAEEMWEPEAGDADWAAYAAWRRAASLLLLGKPDGNPPPGQDYPAQGLPAMQAVASQYAGDPLGDLATAFLAGYGDGTRAEAIARGVAALRQVDLYTYFYNLADKSGTLYFPMDAPGILYPGAGLAAYLNAYPNLNDGLPDLRAGLTEAGFVVTGLQRVDPGSLQVTLQLPEAPNAERQEIDWTLVKDASGWRTATPGDAYSPSELLLDRSADWPVVGDFQTGGVTYTISPPPPTPDPVQSLISPSGGWRAIIDPAADRLDLQNEAGQTFPVFPPDSTLGPIQWSPDGSYLLVVRHHWRRSPAGTGVEIDGPLEIWGILLRDDQPEPPHLVFQSPTPPDQADAFIPEQVVWGTWSPDGRRVLFWHGILSASILADGLTLWVLDTATDEVVRLADVALLNPGYQSWAPDGSSLVFTAGGYRSAQVNKWLDLFEVASGQVRTLVNQAEQIPGLVAWSPGGDWIAYAAVQANQTDDEWADLMTFENPAIAGRRIYLVDPVTGKSRRLNDTDAFQDAPVWSQDGQTVYYVQRQGNTLVLMGADPHTGQAQAIEASRRPAPQAVGYYGQSDWSHLRAYRPDAPRAEVPPLSDTYRDPDGRFSLLYPAGWQVGQGWPDRYGSGWHEMPTLSSHPPDDAATELGPFSGQALIALQAIAAPQDSLEALLEQALASPGPGQHHSLIAFDQRELTMDGRPGLRLQTMDDFGALNHLLLVLDGGQGYILRSQGDGRIFDAVAESLRFAVPAASAPGAEGRPVEAWASAAYIRFESWSPEGGWMAYWLSSPEDVAEQVPATMPGGTLHFANPGTGQTCAVPQFHTQTDRSAWVDWAKDGTAIVVTDEEAFWGVPCQAQPFAAWPDYSSAPSPEPDPALSPDRRYRVRTILVANESGRLTFRTDLLSSQEPRLLSSTTWQIDERLGDYGLGGEWVSHTQFLIYETLTDGPLLLDVQRGVVPVLTELLGLVVTPSILNSEGYSLRATAAPGLEPDSFHLLVSGVGLEANFPVARLYHAESGLVENLPYTKVWGFSADYGWLFLYEEVATIQFDDGGRNTGYNIWGRQLEDVEGDWQLVAPAADYLLWRDDGSELAFTQNETTLVWLTFPMGEPLGHWQTGPYWAYPVALSPDGRYVIAVGNLPGDWEYALFVLEVSR